MTSNSENSPNDNEKLYFFMTAIDKWVDELIKELHAKHKDKIDLMMKLYPPAEVDKPIMNTDPDVYSADVDPTELGLHPPVEALMTAILTQPELNMFFHQMFWQQKDLPRISEGAKIWSWQTMILLINMTMDQAPHFSTADILIRMPISIILLRPLSTSAGYAAFQNDKVNKLFKDILNYWGKFLCTPQSTYVLSDDDKGWFGKDALKAMPNFVQEFECDPSAPHYGFKSWDDFFVRKYREGVRPVEASDDDTVIANACESGPFKVAHHVKSRDLFWVKNHQYSLDHMLNNNDLAKKFYGGTIYQGALKASSYHRWHSPVSGMIFKTELVDGYYYSLLYDAKTATVSHTISEVYVCHVAARAIIYIEADNPDIGLIVFVAVGMSEVSTNEITVKTGDRVKKGDEIGMFHCGGSSHCLVFQPGVNLKFDFHGQTPGKYESYIPVRSRLATVIKPNEA